MSRKTEISGSGIQNGNLRKWHSTRPGRAREGERPQQVRYAFDPFAAGVEDETVAREEAPCIPEGNKGVLVEDGGVPRPVHEKQRHRPGGERGGDKTLIPRPASLPTFVSMSRASMYRMLHGECRRESANSRENLSKKRECHFHPIVCHKP
jgi:hypothetical protein